MVQKVAVLKMSNLALHVDIVIRGIQFQHNVPAHFQSST